MARKGIISMLCIFDGTRNQLCLCIQQKVRAFFEWPVTPGRQTFDHAEGLFCKRRVITNITDGVDAITPGKGERLSTVEIGKRTITQEINEDPVSLDRL